jgi:hypothetical protein
VGVSEIAPRVAASPSASICKSFIASADDGLGYIAFAVFVREFIETSNPSITGELAKKIEALSDETRASVYMAAAKRLADLIAEDSLKRRAAAAVDDNLVYLKLKGFIDDRFDYTDKEIAVIRNGLTLGNQIFVAALAGIIIAAFLIISNYLPGVVAHAVPGPQKTISEN